MEKELFNKIKFYLNKNQPVKVSFSPIPKGCDVTLNDDYNIANFSIDQDDFETWWDDELSDLLTRNFAFGDSIDVEFKLNGESLFAYTNLNCSDAYFLSDCDQHSKDKILTPILTKTIMNHLNLNESDFDEDLVQFNLVYDGEFQNFDIYYDDEVVELNSTVESALKLEVQNIISTWRGTFGGVNYSNYEYLITLEQDCDFDCTDMVSYKFEIEVEE